MCKCKCKYSGVASGRKGRTFPGGNEEGVSKNGGDNDKSGDDNGKNGGNIGASGI